MPQPLSRVLTLALLIRFSTLTDQLSNFRIIPDYLKVVDFIEEMKALHPPLRQTALSDRHFGLF